MTEQYPPDTKSGPRTGKVPAADAAVRPARRRRGRIILLVVAAAIVVLVGGAFVAAEITAKSTFCINCHEMDPYYTAWQASTHKSAQCAQCHVPPGFTHFVATKVYALREVWIHVTGQVKAPLAVTRKIPDTSCLRCHQTPVDRQLGNATFSHQKHTATACIACHVRLVHRGVVGEDPSITYVDPALMTSCFRCHDVTNIAGGCAYCHTPPHAPRGDCSGCHSMQSWAGASPANHPFTLTGKHIGLACAQCHKPDSTLGLIAGSDLGKASPDCSFCHTPGHEARGDCKNCHTTDSFKGGAPANHPFKLTGKHVGLACAQCHKPDSTLGLIAGTSMGKASPDCSFCHTTPHVGPKDCARCHTTAAWKPSTFTHPQEGEHVPQGERKLACADCHPNGYATSTCSKCHQGTPSGD
jgi:nitrate/TMAO reductase-like tetraheme cytochrome c subunit